jgi:hypothetical protein
MENKWRALNSITSDDYPDKKVSPNTISNNGPQKRNGTDSNKKRECTTYKYSAKGKGLLHEAILLSGSPVFVKYENGEITYIEGIEEPGRIIRPPFAEEYPYEPYEFANTEELHSYEEKALAESLDSLYERAKSIVQKYNDQDAHKVILVGTDAVWSYFQDKFSTTHYVGVIGDNGSGKSTVGDTIEAIGYRVVNMTDPSAANLFRILGTLEPGQCTLIADEAEKIDQSPEIMSTLKTGYQFKSKVARVNMNTGKQEFYYTYGFKMIIAERSPNETKAKGVLDRTFVFNTYNGRPKYDIKEVLRPAGDPKRQSLLDELNRFRKLMLIYRLIHFNDRIEDINIGLEGRHKELCKPMLQLFQNTKSLKEIQGAFHVFLNAKNQRKGNSIEAALHPIIVNLVSQNGRDVFAGRIWTSILETIPGTFDEKRQNEFQTHDYGTLYRNTITNVICDKFGAERRHRKEGTVLTFDPEKLLRVGRLYDLETKIQTKIGDSGGEGGDSGEDSRKDTPLSIFGKGEGGDSSEGSREYRQVVTTTQSKNNEEIGIITASNAQKLHEIRTNTSGSSGLVDCFWPNDHPQYPIEPSQPAPHSPKDNNTVLATAVVARSIHRIHPRSDIFNCDECTQTGDKWHMLKHHCKGSKK